MDEDRVLHLLDFYWFQKTILQNSPPPPLPLLIDPNPVQDETQIEKPVAFRLRSLHHRSFSDELSSKSDLVSPNSVPPSPKLETILSGKVVGEFSHQNPNPNPKQEVEKSSRKVMNRRKKKGSRSLSDLEFEELKGFLDLGFTFSEDEMDSRLISILPGLQRLGKNPEEEETVDETAVSRPYLSEAWSARKENPLTNWRIPANGDGSDMKDHLKFWAHAVASTVR